MKKIKAVVNGSKRDCFVLEYVHIANDNLLINQFLTCEFPSEFLATLDEKIYESIA